MSIFGSLYDWLGRTIERDEISVITSQDATRCLFTLDAFKVGVSYIAATMGKSEIKVYSNGKVDRDWSNYTWNVSPNMNETSSKLTSDLVFNLFLEGEALVVPINGSLYLADSYNRERHPLNEDIFRDISLNGTSISKQMKASEVFFFQLNDMEVASLVRRLSNQYSQLLSAASGNFIEMNKKRYKLKLESTKAGDKNFNEEYTNVVSKHLKEFMASDSVVYPEFQGYDLQSFEKGSSSGISADFISLRKDAFETVASVLKMPTSMLYGNVNNIKEVFNIFLTFAFDPVAQMISEEITRKTAAYAGWKNNTYTQVDATRVRHVDLFEVASQAEKLISSTLLNTNEARERLGLDLIKEEWAQQFYVTKNYSLAGELQNEGGENNA